MLQMMIEETDRANIILYTDIILNYKWELTLLVDSTFGTKNCTTQNTKPLLMESINTKKLRSFPSKN